MKAIEVSNSGKRKLSFSTLFHQKPEWKLFGLKLLSYQLRLSYGIMCKASGLRKAIRRGWIACPPVASGYTVPASIVERFLEIYRTLFFWVEYIPEPTSIIPKYNEHEALVAYVVRYADGKTREVPPGMVEVVNTENIVTEYWGKVLAWRQEKVHGKKVWRKRKVACRLYKEGNRFFFYSSTQGKGIRINPCKVLYGVDSEKNCAIKTVEKKTRHTKYILKEEMGRVEHLGSVARYAVSLFTQYAEDIPTRRLSAKTGKRVLAITWKDTIQSIALELWSMLLDGIQLPENLEAYCISSVRNQLLAALGGYKIEEYVDDTGEKRKRRVYSFRNIYRLTEHDDIYQKDGVYQLIQQDTDTE